MRMIYTHCQEKSCARLNYFGGGPRQAVGPKGTNGIATESGVSEDLTAACQAARRSVALAAIMPYFLAVCKR